MSKSKLGIIGEQRPLWLFRDLVDGGEGDDLLEAACRQGRVERWGHEAKIPIFAGGDDVVLVVDGTIIAQGPPGGSGVRLTRGDAFGKTPMGRLATVGDDAIVVEAIRETTICSIPVEELRMIWDAERASRAVRAGGWFNKETLKVPLWPLLGAMPTTRLARILLHLVENYGETDGDRGRLPLTIRPVQLAELAGLDKKRSARVWQVFQGTDLVGVEGGGLVLKDLSTLRQYALAG